MHCLINNKNGYYAKYITVFSDDIAWCKENFKKLIDKMWDKEIYYSTFNHEIADFVAMTHCGYHIMANSSFSWWAAYMAWLTGMSYFVTAPSNWFGPKGPKEHDLFGNFITRVI
jgi:hypothetical protein